jgi:hypothetical protein
MGCWSSNVHPLLLFGYLHAHTPGALPPWYKLHKPCCLLHLRLEVATEPSPLPGWSLSAINHNRPLRFS